MSAISSDPINDYMKVLIVDDDPGQARSLYEMVSLYNYDVNKVESGAAAIEHLQNTTVDIMLLDLNMPNINGFDVIDHVMDKHLSCSIIVLSGDATFELARKALKKGACDFIKKPYLSDELLNTMNNVATRIQLESANRHIEKKLKESEQLHRFIVEHSPDIVFMINENGRFTFINDAIHRILGFAKHEMIGKHLSELIYQQDNLLAPNLFPGNDTDNNLARQTEMKLRVNGGGHRHFEITSLEIRFDHRNDGVFQGIYCVAHDVTDKKQAQDLINYQAYHDLLTDLPNRHLLHDRLRVAITHAKRNTEKFALMFLDLDHFKWVNDTMGHAAGDFLLQQVSHRIANCLREADTLARFGGDEFALILPKIGDKNDVMTIADKILGEFRQPFIIDDTELYITGSIGIAIYPEAGDTIELLIKNADRAMYSVKDKGKNAYEFFNNEVTRETSTYLRIEHDLRHAIANNELKVCYQPKVQTSTEKVVGFEALVRWQHPEKGDILPDDFIPVAEETSLIRDIGDFVLYTVCRDINNWRDTGIDNIRVSINYSSSQIVQENFVEKVFDTLSQFDLPPRCLEIEITEDALVNHMSHLVSKLQRLKSMGIEIAVDDFGTGYSSFNYLQQFPINTLKIDKSFIHSMHAKKGGASIVNAMVAMASGLELNLVAEGVETEKQLEYLKELGCPEIQGWLFGKAESAEQTHSILDQIMKGEKIRTKSATEIHADVLNT
ncbi:MAG: EAL domain-containing protein [Proteobacteria bacterium]|nr:EAL domain-containing protein [Pseudomonadota bacterium]